MNFIIPKLSGFLTVLFTLLALCSCSKKNNPAAFYYWKTNFKLSETEITTLKQLNTTCLYVRFFDVDKRNDSILPLGIIAGLENIPDSMQVIPTVFITNRSFVGITKDEVNNLAQRLCNKINKMAVAHKISFSELQLDCDWSEKTKTAYFDLLQQLKEKLPGKTVSVTIRLHQVKYPIRSGIPPVNKGVLMFYNMGNLTDAGIKNSIYNTEDAVKYTAYIKDYPIPLDYALPVFSWLVHKRAGKVIGLVSKDGIPDTSNSIMLLKQKPGSFKIKLPFLHKGRYYMEGDELLTERINKTELSDAATLLSGNSNKTKQHKIIFFDLDSSNFKHISHETIKEVLDIFN